MAFTGMYSPPNITASLFEEGLTRALEQKPDIIIGDFNCTIQTYMASATCEKGKILKDILTKSGYILLNKRT